ncbi:hypothetical protein [Devosia sp. Root413D1]|jgi:hypothetical protein|uniref:hypothetical protein n=1 Tax=Devosia sp. Root413D1 TaxID=1736531 RepID=UPI000B25FB3A|nr:hypothetical protein [Devosia sp. Root413D1]
MDGRSKQAGSRDALASAGPTLVSISVITASIAIWVASAAVVAAGVGRELAAYSSGTPSSTYGLKILRLDAENTLPVWYSSTQLIACALMLFLQAQQASAERSKQRVGWLLLAFGFVYLSMDETASIHEILIEKVKLVFHTSGVFTFGWVLVAIPAVIVVLLLLWRFILRLPRRTQLLFLGSGAIYVFGAVGLEMLGAPIFEAQGVDAPSYIAFVVTEETFEIVGISLFLTALLLHVHREQQSWLLRVR